MYAILFDKYKAMLAAMNFQENSSIWNMVNGMLTLSSVFAAIVFNYIYTTFRLAYAEWILERMFESYSNTDTQLFVMYDIAFTLHSHLKVLINAYGFPQLNIICIVYFKVNTKESCSGHNPVMLTYISLIWT